MNGELAQRVEPPTVAAEVLAMTVAAAAWLTDRGAPVTPSGIVTAICAEHGMETGRIVREHLVEAGVCQRVGTSP